MFISDRVLRIAILLVGLAGWPALHPQPTVAFDGPTPAGPAAVLSPTRSEIVLNGLWRWLPAAGPSQLAPVASADWGIVWGPGACGQEMWGHYSNVGADSGFAGVQKAGKGAEWTRWNETLRRGWYKRELTVPADWAGCAIVLTFARLATDAELWLDGTHVGRIAWPGGEIDLTAQVKPGRAQRLRVLVSAVQSSQEAINYMGVGQNTATKASIDLHGLTGDVVLALRPAGARVTHVFVKTSVRNKRLALDAEFAGIRPGDALALTAVVTDIATGTPAHTFNAQVVTTAPDAQADPTSTAVVRDLGWEWADAHLWDLDDPHLYRLELQVCRLETAGGAAPVAAPVDVWPVTFGFREFWTEGRDFFLNGTRIRLRPALFGSYLGAMPTAETVSAEFARWKNHGRNFVEVWPSAKDRGSRLQDEAVAVSADQAGMLLAMPTVRMNEFTFGPGYRSIWETPEGRAAWLPAFHADWRRLRNHPSIVMIGLSGNAGGHDQDQNPRWIGRRALPAGQKDAPEKAEVDRFSIAFDPTRPRWHHQGGAFTPLAPGTKPGADELLVLGRDSLVGDTPAFDLGAFVAGGGRALLMAQSPAWVRRNLGLRRARARAPGFPGADGGGFCRGA